MKRRLLGGFVPSVFFLLAGADRSGAAADSTSEFHPVAAVFAKHCSDCHSPPEAEANLVVDSRKALLLGGESGPAIIPGNSDQSLLMRLIDGRETRDGKPRVMPPAKKPRLKQTEIDLLRQWIDLGAPEFASGHFSALAPLAAAPKIPPKQKPPRSIRALAFDPFSNLLAVARPEAIELLNVDSRTVVRSLTGNQGPVNHVAFSANGKTLFAAAGTAGVAGEIRIWETSTGHLIRILQGHRDAVYALAVSPDGKTIASGSYDQKIILWNLENGTEQRMLSGHNGAIYGLSFRTDGRLLASASADRTVKLWNPANGERRDTLSQPLKELYTTAFTPDGTRLIAAGADNRLRIWSISETGAETTNPLLEARYAHEGAILKSVFSSDGALLMTSAEDGGVKIWSATHWTELAALEKPRDWPSALTFAASNRVAVVGRLDGSLDFHDSQTGKLLPPPKPSVSGIWPRGIQSGTTTTLSFQGSNLVGRLQLDTGSIHLKPELDSGLALPEGTNWTIQITAATAAPRGPYSLKLNNEGGQSAAHVVYVDELPQVAEAGTNSASRTIPHSSTMIWGILDPAGDSDEFRFEAHSGQTFIFDLTASTLGSKANPILEMRDPRGQSLELTREPDAIEPLLAHRFARSGTYTAIIRDRFAGGSSAHFYRLILGTLPYVTGIYPLSVQTNSSREIELIGHNLPRKGGIHPIAPFVSVKTPLTVDTNRLRFRIPPGVRTTDRLIAEESEPNGTTAQATRMAAPGEANGRLHQSGDADIFRFASKAGESWIVETLAARLGAPTDTRIEIIDSTGQPIERALLQAVRNSAINFRPIDSTSAGARLDNYEEMELNQYLYLNGEVARLFRMPQGPDSEMLFYQAAGGRRSYFDTSPTSHPLEQPCYIVEPHPPRSRLTANGLPIFPLHYANDDDSSRELGKDSRIYFAAPTDGPCYVRVRDALEHGGPRHAYTLIVRRPAPDFKVSLNPEKLSVSPGSGQMFTITAERIDGFDGPIEVVFTNIPNGFGVASPVVIEAGHNQAQATVRATQSAAESVSAPTKGDDSKNASPEIRLHAAGSALINGIRQEHESSKSIVLTTAAPAKALVELLPAIQPGSGPAPMELVLSPGQTIPALLRVHRHGHEELLTFTVENLPHGVIVDNIGLNGVLIPKGESEREIFLKAARWVPPTERDCFAIEQQVGRQTSLPVRLKVRPVRF